MTARKESRTSETEQPFVFPSYEQSFAELKDRLIHDCWIGMLLVDTSSLKNIEYTFGKTIFDHVNESLKQTVLKLQELQKLKTDDIITIDYNNADSFLVFLSKREVKEGLLLYHYESIAFMVQTFINIRMFPVVFPLLKQKPCITVGYAAAFNNPSVKEEVCLKTMIDESREIARLQAVKNNLLLREQVYQLIMNRQLNTVYQPVVNINTHEVLGYKAFARGPAEAEYENPYVLFSIAREMGLLYELDWLCKFMIYDDAKKLASNLKIFVNIFSSNIRDSRIRIKYLEDLFSETKISLHDVVFEISERYAIEDADFLNGIRKNYSDISLAITLDETWIGSDFSFLKNLKIDYIKLNISLIHGIEEHKLSRELVQSLVNVAAQTGVKIIAEGIQTRKEMAALLDLGIQFGQGFLFAPPGPAFPTVKITEIYLEDENLKNRFFATIFFKRGMDYFNKGIFDGAILEFSKVLELEPDNVEALYHRAYSYHADKSPAAALIDLKTILRIRPDYVNAYLIKAQILDELGKFAGAIEAYQYYIDNAPAISLTGIEPVKKRVENLRLLVPGTAETAEPENTMFFP